MKKIYLLLLTGLFIVLLSHMASALDIQFDRVVKIPEFSLPYRIAITPNQKLVIIDKKPSFHQFNLQGTYLGELLINFPEGTKVTEREYITLTHDSARNMYLTLKNQQTVLVYNSEGQFQQRWYDDSFSSVESFLPIGTNQFLVTDNSDLMLLDNSGVIQKNYDQLELWQPMDLAISSEGHIYMADSNNSCIKVINREGALVNQWGQNGFGFTDFIRPRSIEFDSKERLYILDSNRINEETFASIKVYSKFGELLHFITFEKLDPANEGFFPTDFVIYDDQIFVVDLMEQCVKVYRIIDDQAE